MKRLSFFDLLFILVLILFLQVNPEGRESDLPPPGSLIVEIRWEDNVDCDIDLWVKAPGEKPVGYSNKEELVFNLLRDDLGRIRDLEGLNFEIAYTRGAPVGEYIVNLHAYRCDRPMPVHVRVSFKDRSTVTLYQATPTLERQGHELTAARFWLEGGVATDITDDFISIAGNGGGA